MIEMLNNPWVTGIGGGIISSLIVFFVTKYIFNKGENREYLQKVETANNEILYSIRPLIVEKKIPSNEIFSAVRISTAKKYGVKQEDLHNNLSLSNDLINEIIGNSFLSSDQKFVFCNLLNSMKDTNSDNQKDVEVIYLNKINDSSSKYNSMLLAITSFAMVLSTTFLVTKETTTDIISYLRENIFLVSISTFVPIFAMMITLIMRIIRDRNNERMDIDRIIRDLKRKEVDQDQDQDAVG